MARIDKHPKASWSVAVLMALARENDLTRSRETLSQLAADQVRPLITVARAHGMEAWLSAVAPSSDGEWGALAEQRARFLAARMRSRAEVAALAARFASRDRQWALLKGLTLAGAYPRPDLRHSVDVDVLVTPSHCEEVVDELVGSGYRLLDVNWPVIAQRAPGQLRLISTRGVLIDLHWSLLNEPALRSVLRFPTAGLLTRSRSSGSDGVRVLDNADQLVHVGVHAALAGANKLSWLVDLDRLCRAHAVDWPEVLVRAADSGSGRLLAIALARSRLALGTVVPDWLLDELAGGRLWLRIGRAVDARCGLADDPSRPGLVRSYARSMRPGVFRTPYELVVRGASWLLASAPRQRARPAWLDENDASSALHPVVDVDAKRRYFAAVSTCE